MASSALSPEFKDLPGEIMDIPDDVYEEHQESENTTTMDVNIRPTLANHIQSSTRWTIHLKLLQGYIPFRAA